MSINLYDEPIKNMSKVIAIEKNSHLYKGDDHRQWCLIGEGAYLFVLRGHNVGFEGERRRDNRDPFLICSATRKELEIAAKYEKLHIFFTDIETLFEDVAFGALRDSTIQDIIEKAFTTPYKYRIRENNDKQ